jgi:CheY-like chemotaxis protein
MSLARHTVLVIEDDVNDTMLLQRTFSRFQLAKPLQIVPSGEVAMAYLTGVEQFGDRDRHPIPTLIFLDLRLPGLSGFEVLTWIRQQEHLGKTQVVVLTGSRKSLDVYRAYELGANSYLVKPVKAQDLTGLAQSLKLPWLALTQERKGPPTAPPVDERARLLA